MAARIEKLTDDMGLLTTQLIATQDELAKQGKVVDAAVASAANASTDAGKDFAQRVAEIKAQTEETARAAATDAAGAVVEDVALVVNGANEKAEGAEFLAQEAGRRSVEATEAVEELEGGLFDRIKAKVSNLIHTKLAIGGGIMAVIVWFVRKDILDKVRNGDPLLIEKVVDKVKSKIGKG